MKITINSKSATLKDGPVTGEDVHILAGRPSVLKTNNVDVPNNKSPYTVTEGQAFTAVMH